MIKNFLFLSVSMVLVFNLWAAAPEETLAPPANNAPKTPKKISQDDLVYTGMNPDFDLKANRVLEIKVKVAGRSLPRRDGKVLLQLSAGDKVSFLKDSKDKRWIAVFSLKQRRKVWIPKTAAKEVPVSK